MTEPPAPQSEDLLALVYDELRALARAYLARERGDHTLQPTALVHEAYVKLAPQRVAWKNRAQFVGVAAGAMRRILVDHARGKNRDKRGGGVDRIDLDLALIESEGEDVDLVRLDEALSKLAELSPRQARVVELRFFGGLTVEEVAEVLEVSERTVKSEWWFARAWLHSALQEPEEKGQ
ncbi:MAG: ECF-type sigma factor [Planctomycetota bacterium]